jgi:hypothetical protein
MVRDGETLYAEHEDGVKIEYRFNKEESRFETSGGTCYHLSDLDGLRRLSEKRKRPMTRFEMLAWASSTKSLGWAVRHADVLWRPPQYYGYDMDADRYQRARLLPDLSGVDESTIQGFEVEE